MKTKQLLIVGLVIAFSFTAFAQKGLTPVKKALKTEAASVDPVKAPHQTQTIVDDEVYNYNNQSRSIEKIVIGMSGNIWSYQIDNCNPLSYNDEIGTVGLIARADPATYPEANASGTIMGHYSFDQGTTWEDPCYVYNPETTVTNPRYPNGVVYNPDGNTDPSQAYILGAGPAHLNSEWVHIFDASSKLDGSCSDNYGDLHDWDLTYWANAWSGTNFEAFTGGVARYTLEEVLPDYSAAQINLYKGSWESDHFEFESDDVVEFDLTVNAEGYANRRGMWVGGDDGYGQAFSPDGQIGYTWMIGQDAGVEDYGFIPIIYRTDDGGDNWDQIDYDLGDFEDVFEPYIIETYNGEISPSCNESRSIVDANGNLQMLILAASHSSNHIDSLSYGWVGDFGHLFNFEFTPAGLEKVIWIDSVRADVVPDGDENAYGAGTFWNHRIQISKDPSGDFVFFTWTDTWDEAFEVNARPDIFGNFRNISVDGLASAETIEFTYGGEVTPGFYFYTYASPMGYWDGSTFKLPYIQVLTPPEYFNDDDLQPCTIHYIKGIDFVYEGIGETISNGSLEISQTIPNPTNGLTRVELNLNDNSEVSMVVSNIMGQTVYSNNYGIFEAGQNVIEFDASTWDSGVYFYTVSNGSQKITRKMIVD